MNPPDPCAAEDSATQDRVARLVDYFREYRDRFTPEALRHAAASAGYSARDIDAAWSQLARGSAERPGPATRRKPGVGTVLLVLAVIATYGFTIWLVLALIAASGTFQLIGGQATVLVLFVVSMLVGGVYSAFRLLRAPASGGGARAIGIAFGLSIAIYIGLSGLCIAGLAVR